MDQPERAVQHKMVKVATEAFPALQALTDDEWIGLLRTAGRRVAEADVTSLEEVTRLTSVTTGLPEVRVVAGIMRIAADLLNIEEILAAQSPDGKVAAYRTGRVGKRWIWAPRGRHVAVRVPHNFPTINIEWLQALATRRPVVLVTSPRDPFTPLFLANLLYMVGVPSGAISVCHGDASGIWAIADQMLWPGESEPPISRWPDRVLRYHQGRSKLVLARAPEASIWRRIAGMAVQGCGRLCTSLSGLLAIERAADAGWALADQFARIPILPLDDPEAIVPASPDRATTTVVMHAVEEAVARGAVDLTARLTNTPLVAQLYGWTYLRPTVLLVTADDPIFGRELPFPFVTVAKTRPDQITANCRNSLIVSVVGDCEAITESLVTEPTVDKVFTGDQFDRGYDPVDPHNGYIADFLFSKKALSPFFGGN